MKFVLLIACIMCAVLFLRGSINNILDKEKQRKVEQVTQQLKELKLIVEMKYIMDRRIQEAPDTYSVKTIYNISFPQYATVKISNTDIITATIQNIDKALNGKTITLTPDEFFLNWQWGGTIDKKYLHQ